MTRQNHRNIRPGVRVSASWKRTQSKLKHTGLASNRVAEVFARLVAGQGRRAPSHQYRIADSSCTGIRVQRLLRAASPIPPRVTSCGSSPSRALPRPSMPGLSRYASNAGVPGNCDFRIADSTAAS